MALPFILDENNDFATNIALAIGKLNNIELPKMKATFQSSDEEFNYFLMEMVEESDLYKGSFVVKIPLPGKPGNVKAILRPSFYNCQSENWSTLYKMNDQITDSNYRAGIYLGRQVTDITLPTDYDLNFHDGVRPRNIQIQNLYNVFLKTSEPAISEHGERHINFRYMGKRYKDGWFYSDKYNKNGRRYGFLIAEDPEFEKQVINYFKLYTDDDWCSGNPGSWDLEGAILRKSTGGYSKDSEGNQIIEFDSITIELPKKGNRPFGALDIITNTGRFKDNGSSTSKFSSLEEIHIDQTTDKGKYDSDKSFYDITAGFGLSPATEIPYRGYFRNRLAGYMLDKLPEIAHIDGYTLDCCPTTITIMHREKQYCCIMDHETGEPTKKEAMEYVYQRLIAIEGFNLNLFFREEPLYITAETKPTVETIIDDIYNSTKILLPSAKLGMDIKHSSKVENGKTYEEFILTAKSKFASIYFKKDTFCTIRWSSDQ